MADHSPILFYRAEEIYSQWYLAPFRIDGLQFNCAEQWMMYAKAKLFEDTGAMEAILETSTPRTQKAIGRQVKNFYRSLWDRYAKQIVYQGNLAKFSQNQTLQDQFLATEGQFGEASPYDAIWGIGLGQSDPRIRNPANWGNNWLGKILTLLRDRMRTDPNHRLGPTDSLASMSLPEALKWF